MAKIDVRSWLEEIVADLEPVMPGNVSVELRVSPDSPELHGDQQRLSQVLVNLAINARDAMPNGGSLVISCEACVSWEKFRFAVASPDRYVHLKVRDTGVGIPAPALHRIFEPLFTTKPLGNGVGLALAKDVVQQHGGHIFAESTMGEGTVFHLFLPLNANVDEGRKVQRSTAGRASAQRRTVGSELSRESQFVLIMDDDQMLTEALAAGLEREGRTIVTCNDLESAQLVVERWTPSHIVSDVHLSGPFRFEGLEFIRHAKRHSPASRLILMTGDAPDALQLEASERGAVAFLQKPFEMSELDATLDLISCSPLSSAAAMTSSISMPMIEDILVGKGLEPFFQPIVNMNERNRHIGYEALARYRTNPLLCNPEVLFDYAVRKDRVADLELACISHSLRAGEPLAPVGKLFMNIHPAVLTRCDDLRELLLREARGWNLDQIILEITEQASLPNDESVFQGIDRLRDLGVRFAFDDVGVAYSHLPYITRVKPSFLKISQHFGTAFEADAGKKKIVTNLVTLARDFGCEIILEGIEHTATAQAAAQMGIQYGQGFLFSRPADANAFARN
jgi:EAL domain-containing protein (putative c-di-GMP-specific phosphodiesterase class I)